MEGFNSIPTSILFKLRVFSSIGYFYLKIRERATLQFCDASDGASIRIFRHYSIALPLFVRRYFWRGWRGDSG